MTELKRYSCITCGMPLKLQDGKFVCANCKNEFYLEEKISEEEVIALNRATTDRTLLRFDDAFEEYELLLRKYPKNEMANWGAFLSFYGIIYEQDLDGKYIPTCHRLSEKPVESSKYYRYLNASHKRRAEEIENLRVAILQKAQRIPPYDVFLCYKATEERFGRPYPTKESSWARDVYEMLTHELKLRVFFAEKSLGDSNEEYEPHIYSALNSAKLMFVMTTGMENVNAVWVKNEWKRYSKYMQEGQNKTLRVVYDNIEPYDLPMELQKTQAINHNEIGWGEKVRKAAESIFVDALHGHGKADKYCIKCGTGNVKAAKFCSECGNNTFAPDSKQYCLACGTASELLKKHCPNCGETSFVYTYQEYEENSIGEDFTIENGELIEYNGKEKRVIIPSFVTSIGDFAFEGCTCLEEVIIPENVTSIGDSAFCNCFDLKKISIPSGVTSIGCSAFYGCYDLMSVVIPDGVTCIEEETFKDCKNLTSIVIPDSVISIGENAFAGCNALKNITIPDSVISIGEGAFEDCENLTGITLGSGITDIGDNAFSGCVNLSRITFPQGLNSIGDGAFWNCESLSSVVIPNSVSYIGEDSFAYCLNLANISVGGDNENYKSIDGNLYSKDGKTLMQYALGKIRDSYTLPNEVRSISEDALKGCKNLQSIQVGSGHANYKSIDGNLYSKDGKVLIQYALGNPRTSFTVPNGVQSIAAEAFSRCENLTSIIVPNGVVCIGAFAFQRCSKLTVIVLPSSIKAIDSFTFLYCSQLKNIRFQGTMAQWKAIKKNSIWDDESLATDTATDVVCLDGVVKL